MKKETLRQLRADTGLPLDMVETLFQEKKITVESETTDQLLLEEAENERMVQAEKWGIPPESQWRGSFAGQTIEMEKLALLSSVSQKAKIQAVTKSGNVELVVLDHCPFFPTQAGQEGDRGVLVWNGREIGVMDTVFFLLFVSLKIKHGQTIINVLPISNIPLNSQVDCVVDLHHRQAVARHHSATHLLHACLEELSGVHQSLQAGSHITEKEFSFDFYTGFLTPLLKTPQTFIECIESKMNAVARAEIPVKRVDFTAKELESVPKGTFIGDISHISQSENVYHTISIGNLSREFCCGQHVPNSADLFPIVISGVQSISAGIKRITGKAGMAASEVLFEQHRTLNQLLSSFACNEKEIVKKAESLQSQLKSMEQTKAALLRFAASSMTPSYEVACPSDSSSSTSQLLQVYEIPAEIPKEIIEKLVDKDSLQLFVHSKTFTLVCGDDKLREKLKTLLFQVGEGGKGGGKKGILKGVCNASLVNKKQEIEIAIENISHL